MSKRQLTDDEMRELLRKECDKVGGQSAWAATANVSAPYVSDVLNGKRDPGDSITRALGYERRVVYVRKDIWEEREDS